MERCPDAVLAGPPAGVRNGVVAVVTEMNGQAVHAITDSGVLRVVRPVIGPRRARVAYPLDAPATIAGPYGRAWYCDLAAARQKLREAGTWRPDAMVAHWIVEAPWSHEIVHSYSLVLVHLRFSLAHAPVVRYLEGATHGVDLYAIHPAAPRGLMLAGPINPTMWIPPIAFASQIAESTDEAAEVRVRRAVELVCGGRLSPHPDHVRSWAELFGDCMLPAIQAERAEWAAKETDG